jgi:hypothetical protein
MSKLLFTEVLVEQQEIATGGATTTTLFPLNLSGISSVSSSPNLANLSTLSKGLLNPNINSLLSSLSSITPTTPLSTVASTIGGDLKNAGF